MDQSSQRCRKEYKILSDKYLEHLMQVLNEHGDEGWSVVLYLQEFGVTKVLLEREVVLEGIV